MLLFLGLEGEVMFIEHFHSGGFVTTSISPAGSSIPESSINIISTLPLMPNK
jgi:hypothetical protein